MAAKRLTARFVETASTDRDREDIRDAATPGLQLRVTRHGAKAWALRYRRKSDGRQRRLTLGSFPAVSLEEARISARSELARIARGADPAGEARERREAETFQQVATEWTERHAEANRSLRVLKNDLSLLRRHILPELGGMKAAEITKRDVIRLLDRVLAKPDGRAGHDSDEEGDGEARRLTHQPNRVFQLVRAIFRWAISRDILTADPTLGLKAPIAKEAARERELSPEEIRTLWCALEKAPAQRRAGKGLPRGTRSLAAGDLSLTRPTAVAMLLALVTAQRIGEVSGIAKSELDLNDTAPVWTVPGARSKNGEPNRVPLSPIAVRLIQQASELAADSPWLFPSPTGRGPVDPHAATRALARAREALGLADFRIHDLRRTAATRMGEMGINPHTISVVLNHISVRKGTITGKVYNRYAYDREKREALSAWGARLERILEATDGANVVALTTP